MFIPLIKNIVIFYMCFYSYNKICKISKHTFNFFLPYVFFSLLLGLETYIFKAYVPIESDETSGFSSVIDGDASVTSI